ncbi:MAG: UDP binding domain-containing protein, partial [Saprospiraceae bacterium]
HKARELGYEPQVIAAGRRVNDYMPHFIAKKLVQALIEAGKNPGECRVLVMGITFKEDVSDIRNSKVVDLIHELEDYSVSIDVIDPHASIEEVKHTYGIDLKRDPIGIYDAVVIAVGHREYATTGIHYLRKLSIGELILIDIKGVVPGKEIKRYITL